MRANSTCLSVGSSASFIFVKERRGDSWTTGGMWRGLVSIGEREGLVD